MEKLNEQEIVKIITQPGKTLLKFGASWCGPCRALAPVLKDISDNERINVIDIDVDHVEPGVLEMFKIRSVPLLVAYESGTPLKSQTGMQSKANILAMFETSSEKLN
jgi:thioredoxin 1